MSLGAAHARAASSPRSDKAVAGQRAQRRRAARRARAAAGLRGADRRRCSRGASSATCAAGQHRGAGGERFGLIMFGSRVDVFLPPSARVRGDASATACAPARRSSRSTQRHERSNRCVVLSGRGRRRIPPLRKGVYILPNLFTTGGPVRRLLLDHRDARRTTIELAAIMVLVAQLFDVLDGRIARLTRTSSRVRRRVRFARRPGRLRRRARHPGLHVGARAVGALGLARGVALRHLRRASAGALQRAGRHRWRSAHFVGLPIPAAADMIVATVLLYYYFGGEGRRTSTSSCCCSSTRSPG